MIQRGKKEYEHFLSFINHLNQQKSPSATLVSKEKKTFSNAFFPEVMEVLTVGGGCGVSRKFAKFVKKARVLRDEVKTSKEKAFF